MITIGYYTTDELYQSCFDLLELSLKKQQLEYDYKPIAPSSWKDATGLKPKVVKEMLLKHKQAVVYVDVDAFVHENYEAYFSSLACDLGIYFLEKKDGSKELLSGSLYFEFNETVLALIDVWIACIDDFPEYNDQQCLEKALEIFQQPLNIKPIDLAYIYIFDREYESKVEPVIEHLQASRELYLAKKLGSKKYKIQALLGIKNSKVKKLDARANRLEYLRGLIS